MGTWRRAAAVAAGLVVLTGCAGAAGPERPAAQVADTADCAVRETLDAFGTGGGDDLPAAPPAGSVPDGFEPVAAVECRLGVEVAPAPEPQPVPDAMAPDATAPDATAPAADGPATAGTLVDVVRLEGDLAPLLEQLQRPDVPAQPDQACMAMFEVVPVLYLVDAGDRAVRVQWPTGPCGFLLDGARTAVDALEVTSRSTITVA
ncbi:hypothetical protein [Cellulomonas wangsupingiae]|uniref:hypothetical protein n=1 Tax=Cellulomonas wangsupingiae TaxID=2968085 RepID=UPI001D0E3FE1|nr:hypothetical protein [Cellulomonas wangsupingiae]MCM0641361.1 hypothetical protein [Cellulomonas wangsupingiae]